jgi:hypothetical protein
MLERAPRGKREEVMPMLPLAVAPRMLLAALSVCAVLVTRVGAQPLPVYQLREEWRTVSDESSRDMQLTAVTGLRVLPDGRIVTVHRSEALLRVFDSTGKFLQTVGRRGQGPGEFQMPSGVGYVNDTLWVRDPSRGAYVLFDRSLTYVGQAVMPRVGAFHPGRMSAGTLARVVSGVDTAWAFLDNGGEVLKRVHVQMRNVRQSFTGTREGSPTAIAAPFSAVTQLSIGPDGRDAVILEPSEIWGGQPGQFSIQRLTADGRLSERVVVSLPPQAMSRAYSDSVLAAWNARNRTLRVEFTGSVEVPKYHQAFGLFDYFADGQLWLLGRDRTLRTVVRTDGRPLMQVRIPANLSIGHANATHVWGTIRDADDVPAVVRYRLERVTPPR